MCNYLTKAEWKELQEVPDPYFGGPEGFEKVMCTFSQLCDSDWTVAEIFVYFALPIQS